MKVLANGGLNISEIDGWWAEAYTPEVGWAIGDGKEHGEDPAWDASEVESLYTLLEQQVVPEFYARDAQGMPSRWLERVRESMATLTPAFSASRTIREYTNDHYLPAAAGYKARSANDGRLGTDLAAWQRAIAEQWHTLRFDNVETDTKDGQHHFGICIVPGGLQPDQFRVELYASPTEVSGGLPEVLVVSESSAGASGTFLYTVCCPAKRPAMDYTARLVPSHAEASVPLEAVQILWQR
jgi:starch phosphorylase